MTAGQEFERTDRWAHPVSPARCCFLTGSLSAWGPLPGEKCDPLGTMTALAFNIDALLIIRAMILHYAANR